MGEKRRTDGEEWILEKVQLQYPCLTTANSCSVFIFLQSVKWLPRTYQQHYYDNLRKTQVIHPSIANLMSSLCPHNRFLLLLMCHSVHSVSMVQLQEHSLIYSHDMSSMWVLKSWWWEYFWQWLECGFPWNSNGFPWIPSGIFPGGSGIPIISIGTPWKKVGFRWKWKPNWLRLQPNGFHRYSMEFCGILTFHCESIIGSSHWMIAQILCWSKWVLQYRCGLFCNGSRQAKVAQHGRPILKPSPTIGWQEPDPWSSC